MTDTSERRTDQVSRAYAQALFEMAEEKGVLDEVADEMDQVGDLLRSQPALWHLMESPALTVGERADSLKRLFEGQLTDVLYRFLQVLNHKHRLDALKGITQAFSDLVANRRGLVEVDAFVPERLSTSEAEQVSQRIGQILKRQVVLHQYVDESLIGGIKLRVGDRLIDGSVATQLRRLREQLERTGHAQAKRGIGAEGES